MRKEFVNEMKDQLEAEKARLTAELENFAKEDKRRNGDLETDFQNIGDKEDESAEEVATQSINTSLEDTLEDTLRDIEKALDRIKKDNYGTCKYCNKEIDEKRLRARPSSSSCVECKKSFTNEF